VKTSAAPATRTRPCRRPSRRRPWRPTDSPSTSRAIDEDISGFVGPGAVGRRPSRRQPWLPTDSPSTSKAIDEEMSGFVGPGAGGRRPS